MKKLFLFALIAAVTSFSISAKGFESQIRVSGEIGIDSYKNNSFGVDYVGGYKITDMFRVGAGVGVSYIDLMFEDSHFVGTHWSDKYKESAVEIPIFIDGKLNFTNGNISPYLNLDLGYAIYVPCSDYAKNNKLGFFVKPAFGVDFNIGKGAIFAQVGYNYQMRKCEHWADTNGNYSQISIAIGYIF